MGSGASTPGLPERVNFAAAAALCGDGLDASAWDSLKESDGLVARGALALRVRLARLGRSAAGAPAGGVAAGDGAALVAALASGDAVTLTSGAEDHVPEASLFAAAAGGHDVAVARAFDADGAATVAWLAAARRCLQAAAPAGSKADGSRPPAHSFFVAAVDGDGDEDKELVVALAAWCESLAAPDGLVILDFGANADARASLADGSPPARNPNPIRDTVRRESVPERILGGRLPPGVGDLRGAFEPAGPFRNREVRCDERNENFEEIGGYPPEPSGRIQGRGRRARAAARPRRTTRRASTSSPARAPTRRSAASGPSSRTPPAPAPPSGCPGHRSAAPPQRTRPRPTPPGEGAGRHPGRKSRVTIVV